MNLRSPRSFRLTTACHRRDGTTVPAGTVVYEFRYTDYGLANDDTRATGVEHVSVTLDAEGKWPSFTVPKSHLEPLTVPSEQGTETAREETLDPH